MDFIINQINSLVSSAVLVGFVAFLLMAVAGQDGTSFAKTTVQTIGSITIAVLRVAVESMAWLFLLTLRLITLVNPKLQPVLDHLFGDGSSDRKKK